MVIVVWSYDLISVFMLLNHQEEFINNPVTANLCYKTVLVFI